MKKILVLIISIIILQLSSAEVSDKKFLEFAKKMGIKSELILKEDAEYRYAIFHENNAEKYFVLTSDFHQEIGYQGNTTVGLNIDKNHKIEKIKILESEDTRSFIKRLKRKSYLNQFLGNPTENNIKHVSGATLSSDAVKKDVIKTFSTFVSNSNLSK